MTDPLTKIISNKLKYSLCDSCYREGVYKIVCAQTVGHDLTYAKAAKGMLADKVRWFVERLKKRVWLEREEPREKDMENVWQWIKGE